MNEFFRNTISFLNHNWLILLVLLFVALSLLQAIRNIKETSSKVNLVINDRKNRPNRKATKDFWKNHFICVKCLGDFLLKDRDEDERSFKALGVVHGVCKKCSWVLKQNKQ